MQRKVFDNVIEAKLRNRLSEMQHKQLVCFKSASKRRRQNHDMLRKHSCKSHQISPDLRCGPCARVEVSSTDQHHDCATLQHFLWWVLKFAPVTKETSLLRGLRLQGRFYSYPDTVQKWLKDLHSELTARTSREGEGRINQKHRRSLWENPSIQAMYIQECSSHTEGFGFELVEFYFVRYKVTNNSAYSFNHFSNT